MNMLARPPERLAVDVVFDLVCPWCWIGLRRLTRTLSLRRDLGADLTFQPFLLNPDMPARGMAHADYVQRKFGGEDRARRLHAAIAEVGRAEGVAFRFDRILRTPAHYRRFAGQRVHVELVAARNGRRRYTGALERTGDEDFDVNVDGSVVTIRYGEVAQTRLAPDWSRQKPRGKRR